MIDLRISITVALAILAFFYGFQRFRSENTQWYNKVVLTNVNIAPPAWVFAIVWLVLYVFIAASMSVWSDVPVEFMNDGVYVATWVVFLCNAFFNVIWIPLFFDLRGRSWGLPLAIADAVLIVLTAIAVVVLFHVGHHIGWFVFFMWYCYIVWVIYALVLTVASYIVLTGRGEIENGSFDPEILVDAAEMI
jgi:tryptophan-rich sensory protein